MDSETDLPPQEPQGPARRRRGGQPGNANAVKHGFYARHFHPAELADLETVNASLQDEIAALRVIMRRLLEFSGGTEDLDTFIVTAKTLGVTATRIASLTRTSKLISGGDTDVAAALSQALAEISKELPR